MQLFCAALSLSAVFACAFAAMPMPAPQPPAGWAPPTCSDIADPCGYTLYPDDTLSHRVDIAGNVASPSEANCQAKCSAHNNCVGYIWSPSRSVCWYSSAMTSQPFVNADATSGFKSGLRNYCTACPGATTEMPAETTEASFETTEASFDTTEASFDTTEASFDTTEATFDTTEASVDTTEASFETTEASFDTTEASFDTTEASGETTMETVTSLPTTCDSSQIIDVTYTKGSATKNLLCTEVCN